MSFLSFLNPELPEGIFSGDTVSLGVFLSFLMLVLQPKSYLTSDKLLHISKLQFYHL